MNEATTPNPRYANTVTPQAVVAAWVPAAKGGLFGGGERLACTLSARIFVGCGRVDWYAKDLQLLARFAADGTAGVSRQPR